MSPSQPDRFDARPLNSFPEPAQGDATLDEKRRAGTALRRIIDDLIMRHPAAEDMAALASRLESLADDFAAMPEKAAPRTSFAHRISAEDVRDFVEFSPITGRSNPIAAPLDIWVENGLAVGRVTFGRGFEGAPGVAHGGHVAAIFDELLGFAQGFSGQPGMTGTLTITYRAPTPLLTELRLEGRYDGTEGRKIYTSGRLWAGDTLLAEAKGLFITLTDAQYAAVTQMQG